MGILCFFLLICIFYILFWIVCSMPGVDHSPQKMQLIHSMCQDLGVLTKPTRLGPVLICPLVSWHHQSFDREPDIPGIPRPSPLFVSDYRACTWPEGFPGRWVHLRPGKAIAV